MMKQRALVDEHLQRWLDTLPRGPLYDPMAYLLGLPAKRVRPVLTLMACELFGGRAVDVLDEAIGIELFHNFTLMHDDIMDASPLRRGMATVHMKWDVNTAILSGDAMLVKAYQLMGSHPEVLAIFNRHALEVCEGQQLDMDLVRRTDVGLEEYRAMIRAKTAVLLSCALRIGACKAGASKGEQERISSFGENLGLAFQLRDDLLDAFGDPAVTGKQQGGDLINGKKTWLLIRGMEEERARGGGVLHEQLGSPADKRDARVMIAALKALGIEQEANAEVVRLEAIAFAELDAIDQAGSRTQDLRAMVEALRVRVS